MTKNEIQLGLLVAYGAIALGLLILFQQNGWRMPGWVTLPLVAIGMLLIGWALWTDRFRRGHS